MTPEIILTSHTTDLAYDWAAWWREHLTPVADLTPDEFGRLPAAIRESIANVAAEHELLGGAR